MARCCLAAFGLRTKELDLRGRGLTLSPAFLAEPFGQNDPVGFIKVP